MCFGIRQQLAIADVSSLI